MPGTCHAGCVRLIFSRQAKLDPVSSPAEPASRPHSQVLIRTNQALLSVHVQRQRRLCTPCAAGTHELELPGLEAAVRTASLQSAELCAKARAAAQPHAVLNSGLTLDDTTRLVAACKLLASEL